MRSLQLRCESFAPCVKHCFGDRGRKIIADVRCSPHAGDVLNNAEGLKAFGGSLCWDEIVLVKRLHARFGNESDKLLEK